MKVFTSTVILVALLGCLGAKSVRQDSVSNQEIASLVSQLSWGSVGGECNGYWRVFPKGPAAKRLIQIGKPSTGELLRVLNDEQRGVAAHLILIAIWEPDNISYEDHLEGDCVERCDYIHVYNGLEWADVINFKTRSVSFKVNNADLIRNSYEWHRKLAQ